MWFEGSGSFLDLVRKLKVSRDINRQEGTIMMMNGKHEGFEDERLTRDTWHLGVNKKAPLTFQLPKW